MHIATILDVKGTAVTTMAPDRTIAEVVALLADKKIGAVVVVGGSQDVLGILSERDIIRALASRSEGVLKDTVSQHMTAKVVTAARDMTVDEAMSIMTSGRFRHLPVVEGGRLAGLISIGDVVKQRLEENEQEKKSMLDYITAV